MIRALSLLLLFLFSSMLFANTQTNALPDQLHIQSDQAVINFRTGVNTFLGHVKLHSKIGKASGDKLIAIRNLKSKKITKITDYGNLAHYTALRTQSGKPPIYAKSRIIEFLPLKHLVNFKQKAEVTEGTKRLEGPLIVYNTLTHAAHSKGNKEHRVHIQVQRD